MTKIQTTLKCKDCGNEKRFHTIETQVFAVEPIIYLNNENEPTIDICDTNNFENSLITCSECYSTNIEEPNNLQHNFT